jgi:hypothetical protein
MPHPRSRALALGVALGWLVLTGSGALADEEDQFTLNGLQRTHIQSVTDFDSISLLSGTLHFEIPIYRAQVNSGFSYSLVLAYNSDIWRMHPDPDDEMRIGAKSPAGLGFRFHLGRIYRIDAYGGGNNNWYYEESNGTPHRLRPETINGRKFYWTKDSTFIRAEKLEDTTGTLIGWSLWTPDGTRYTLDHEVVGGGAYLPNYKGWYTTEIRSPVEPDDNWVAVSYSLSAPACPESIQDSLGRVVVVTCETSLCNHPALAPRAHA